MAENDENLNENAAGKDYKPTDDTTEITEANKGKIIILGAYLLLMIFLSVYLIGALMMAETDREKICAKPGITCSPLAAAGNTSATPGNSNTTRGNINATPGNTNVTPRNTNVTTGNTNVTTGNTNVTTGNTNVTVTNAGGTTNTTVPGNTNATPGNTNATTVITTKLESKPPSVTIPSEVYINIALWPGMISGDSYVFLVVLFSGMLGGVIRSIYSFVGHLGLKNFAFNWTWFYISVPFSGAALAVVLYLVIRGGFFGGSFGKDLVLNLFSFAALGALTGLFTDQVMGKLKTIAETLFQPAAPKVANAKEIMEKNEADKGK